MRPAGPPPKGKHDSASLLYIPETPAYDNCQNFPTRQESALPITVPEQNPKPETDSEANPGSLEANLESRRSKLDRIRQRGIDPYPPRFERDCTAAAAIARFEAAESEGVPLGKANPPRVSRELRRGRQA